MNPLTIGVFIALTTVVVLATGVPVAFGLGVVAMIFLVMFDGFYALTFFGELFFSGLSDFTLVSIP
ncbi:MAG: TRAP transporter large permease, partial [Gammaproteobacteria bacterium]|nr:TRAP transporter large permease [Gammaproteobacteria bacterium]